MYASADGCPGGGVCADTGSARDATTPAASRPRSRRVTWATVQRSFQQRRAAQARARAIAPGENHPVQIGAVEDDALAGMPAARPVPRAGAECDPSDDLHRCAV